MAAVAAGTLGSPPCANCVASPRSRHDAFVARIDRATDARLSSGLGGSQRDHEVVKPHHGTTGSHSHDLALLVQFPAFARPGQYDVLLLGIDEYILNPLNAGQVLHFIVERGAGLAVLGDRGFQSTQRNFAQSQGLQFGRHGAQRLGPGVANLVRFVRLAVSQHTVGADPDTAHLLLNAAHDLRWQRWRPTAEGMRPAPRSTVEPAKSYATLSLQ